MSIKRLKQCCLFDFFRTCNCLTMTLSITVFLFLFTQTGAQESQLKGPENTLGVAGSNVTLKCASPLRGCREIYWWKPSSSGRMTVFRDGQGISGAFRDRHSVDNSSGCDLIIRNVELGDAELFACQTVISSIDVYKTAYLFILDTEPQCTTNVSQNDTVEKDRVRLSCSVSVTGTNRASMIWERVIDAPNAVVQGRTTSRSFIVNASVPEVPSFTCITSFPVTASDDSLAVNVQSTTCKTSAIKVLYSVRDVTILPSLSNYPPGTPVTCAAKGHPSPIFKWQETDTNGIWKDIQNRNGSVFTENVASSKRYRCVATNFVRGQSHNATSYEFQVYNTGFNGPSTTTNYSGDHLEIGVGINVGIGVGVGCIVSILLATIVIAILVKFKYLKFHPRSAKESLDGGAQSMDHEMNPSSPHRSDRPAPSGAEQESDYASLGDDRDVNEYASLEQRQRAKQTQKTTLGGEQESTYESLGGDRDENEYASLEQRQRAKPKKETTPYLTLLP